MSDTDTSTPKSTGLLLALNHLANAGRRHMYAGTVHPQVTARHRAANKVARASRRTNRKGR